MTEEIKKALKNAKTAEETKKIIAENKLTEDDLNAVGGGFFSFERPENVAAQESAANRPAVAGTENGPAQETTDGYALL